MMTLETLLQIATALGVLIVPPATMYWSRWLTRKDKGAEEEQLWVAYTVISNHHKADPNSFKIVEFGTPLYHACEELTKRGLLSRAHFRDTVGYKIGPILKHPN